MLDMSFAAMEFKFGTWKAYQINMKTEHLVSLIRLSDEVFSDPTIDNAMQRKPDMVRARKGIGNYINRNRHRFFNSIVIAVVGGEPEFTSIVLDEKSPGYNKIPDGTFGMLSFSGTQDYYALDGQHRLVGIKEVLDVNSPLHKQMPSNFNDEQLSVILVVQPEDVTEVEFRRRYRRLFGNLNRNQKPTSEVTNIIMDEDNIFNILTRKLIMEHPFFKAEGDNIVVKTNEGGKNITSTENFFTSLETLNAMNTILLTSHKRSTGQTFVKIPDTEKLPDGPEMREITTLDDSGNDKSFPWKISGTGSPAGDFAKYTLTLRQDEVILDSLAVELFTYWDAILETLPFLYNEPMKMRELSKDPYTGRYIPSTKNSDEIQQNGLFRPIMQIVFCRIVRNLLDADFQDDSGYSLTKIKNSLKVLKEIDWSLFSPPFRGLMFHNQLDDENNWIMYGGSDRSKAQKIATDVLDWMLSDASLDENTMKKYKLRYKTLHQPRALSDSEIDEIWNILSKQRRKIQSN